MLRLRGRITGYGELPPEAAVVPTEVIELARGVIPHFGMGGGMPLVLEHHDAEGNVTTMDRAVEVAVVPPLPIEAPGMGDVHKTLARAGSTGHKGSARRTGARDSQIYAACLPNSPRSNSSRSPEAKSALCRRQSSADPPANRPVVWHSGQSSLRAI